MLLPDFDIAPFDVLFCCFDGGLVVLAVEQMSCMEDAIGADDVGAIVGHEGSLSRGREHNSSQSP